MSMWHWTIKQNNLPVAYGFSEDKETALTEMFRYADQYSEEDFDKMIVTLERKENDTSRIIR